MIHSGSAERLKASFARQFDQEGRGFLYRKNETGPAIRISAEEQADFIADYSRALKLSGWAIVATIILGGFATGFYEGGGGTDRKVWGGAEWPFWSWPSCCSPCGPAGLRIAR